MILPGESEPGKGDSSVPHKKQTKQTKGWRGLVPRVGLRSGKRDLRCEGTNPKNIFFRPYHTPSIKCKTHQRPIKGPLFHVNPYCFIICFIFFLKKVKQFLSQMAKNGQNKRYFCNPPPLTQSKKMLLFFKIIIVKISQKMGFLFQSGLNLMSFVLNRGGHVRFFQVDVRFFQVKHICLS